MLSSNTCNACNASLDNLSDDIGNSSYAVVIMPNNQSVEIGELVNSVNDTSTVGDNDRALGDPWPPDIEMSYALAYRSGPPRCFQMICSVLGPSHCCHCLPQSLSPLKGGSVPLISTTSTNQDRLCKFPSLSLFARLTTKAVQPIQLHCGDF